MRYLDEWLARPDPKERPVDVLGVLASIGPAAAEALPLVERWRAEGEGEDDPRDPGDPLDAAIIAIRR